MNKYNDSERSFYRKDYNPRKPLYIGLAAIVLVAAAVWFVFLNKSDAVGDSVNPEPVANRINNDLTPGSKGTGAGDNGDPGSEETGTFETQNSDSENTGSITDDLKKEFDRVETDPLDIAKSSEPGKQSTDTIKISDEKLAKQFFKGHEYFFAKNYKEALKIYNEIAAYDTRVEIFVGMCHYHMSDFDTAMTHLETGLQAEPKNILALKYLAFTAYKKDELEESLKYAEQGLKLRNDDELSNLKNKLGREIKTMEHYGKTERMNFNISFSKIEEGNVRTMVVEHLEDAYRVIGRELDYYPPNPITVILYNEKGFFDVTRSPGWAGALFDGKIRLPIDGLEDHEHELKRILFHEYAHAMVSSILGEYRCPTWFNEGLAEYLSDDHGTKIGQIIPLSSLENSWPTGDTRAVLAAYVESYSAVTYLIDRYKMYNVRKFLDALAEGKDLKKAFETAFYITYDRFLKTWGKKG